MKNGQEVIDYIGAVNIGSLYRLNSPLGNGTGHRTATTMATLLLTSSTVKYEALLHSCETNPVWGDRYRLVTVLTHDNFIVLPHWNTRLLAQ